MDEMSHMIRSRDEELDKMKQREEKIKHRENKMDVNTTHTKLRYIMLTFLIIRE